MTADDAAQLYLRRGLDQMPRSISLEDREPLSRTYGCFDRTYWAWKFVDFPGARYQEGVYPLAFVYAVADDGRGYLGNARVLEWIHAGLDYWTHIQYRDGSFDEAYPFEHSLAATAFTGFYIAEAVRLIGDHLNETTHDRVRSALLSAGDWLCRNDETHGFLSNHLAAAAGALVNIGKLYDRPRLLERSRYFLRRILDHQSSEGWYDEYGGADPGYQTHGTFYLARCWELTDDDELADSLDRSARFLEHFIHVDGTLGGEYGSRSTQFVYPAGFEILAGRSDAAGRIAQRLAESIHDRRVASLDTMDAQNFYPLLNNTLFAARAALARAKRRDESTDSSVSPSSDADRVSTSEQTDCVTFADAGLIKVVRPAYELIVGASKGGVFKLFDRRRQRLVDSDCGYVGRISGGKLATSQNLDRSIRADLQPDRIEIEVPFYASGRTVFAPLKFVVFRLVNLTLGRVPTLARWVKDLLVKVLIVRRKALPLRLRRTILLAEDGIEVRDRIWSTGHVPLTVLRREATFSTVHMGSSRYFQPNELLLDNREGAEEPAEIGRLERLAEGIEVRRSIKLPEGGIARKAPESH